MDEIEVLCDDEFCEFVYVYEYVCVRVCAGATTCAAHRSPVEALRMSSWSVSWMTFCMNTCSWSTSPNGPARTAKAPPESSVVGFCKSLCPHSNDRTMCTHMRHANLLTLTPSTSKIMLQTHPTHIATPLHQVSSLHSRAELPQHTHSIHPFTCTFRHTLLSGLPRHPSLPTEPKVESSDATVNDASACEPGWMEIRLRKRAIFQVRTWLLLEHTAAGHPQMS